MGRILIVDDEPHTRRVLALNLRQDGHEITECSGVREARRCIQEGDFDTVLTDQKMPDGDGLQVLAAALQADPIRLASSRGVPPPMKGSATRMPWRRLGW